MKLCTICQKAADAASVSAEALADVVCIHLTPEQLAAAKLALRMEAEGSAFYRLALARERKASA